MDQAPNKNLCLALESTVSDLVKHHLPEF